MFKQIKMHFEATYHGLGMWLKHEYELLGWMLLAAEEGHDYKITGYKKDIAHLKKSITDKLKTIRDEDKKDDLKILLEKATFLETKVNAIFEKFEKSKKK